MKNKEIKNIHQELVSSYKNLKAEILVTEILKNSALDIEDIDIFNKSTFSRSYRRDVIDFNIDSHSGSQSKLQFNLTRNGIYDTLPQGVFHESVKTKTDLSYAEIRKLHKKEEKSARSFFAPIENELFIQKVNIEQSEQLLIDQFTNLTNSFLTEFWGIDQDVPKEYAFALLQLLPFAHKISGDIELMQLALQKIIEVPVKIKRTSKTYDYVEQPQNDNRLGFDMALQLNHSNILYPVFKIIVGPVTIENEEKFLEKGVAKKIISIFCDYFVPVEIDTELEIQFPEENSVFIIDENNSPRIGLTTII